MKYSVPRVSIRGEKKKRGACIVLQTEDKSTVLDRLSLTDCPWQIAAMESRLLFQEHLNIPWSAPVLEAAGCARVGHTKTLRQSVYFLQDLEHDSGAHSVFFCRSRRGSLSQEEKLFTYRLHEQLKYCFISAKWASRSPSSPCCCLQIQD